MSSLIGTSRVGPVRMRREHHPCILEFLKAERHQGYYNDVTIKSEDKIIPANKAVLSFSSLLLRKIFRTKSQAGYQPVVDMQNVRSDVLELVVNFMYDEEITISLDNVEEMLYTSNYLQMEDLKGFCLEYLSSAITSRNCFTITALAEMYKSLLLKTTISAFVNANFEEIVTNADFSVLDIKKLEAFIDSVEFVNSKVSQKAIYKCIVKWTKTDEENRKVYFPQLLHKVVLEMLTTDFLRNDVTKEPLVKEMHACSIMVLDAVTKKLDASDGRKSSLILLGGSFTMSCVMVMYEIEKERWSTLTSIPQGRRSAAAVAVKNCLYFIGGTFGKDSVTDRVDCFDLDDGKWHKVEPMQEKRHAAAASVIGDLIFVSGGEGSEGACKSSGEVYSTDLNKWQRISDMLSARSGHALLTCNENLYAVGGKSELSYLHEVERFSPEMDQWTEITNLQVPRCGLAAVVLDNAIYAFGGCSEQMGKTLRSVEMYDERKNCWSYVESMSEGRESFAACVNAGLVYAVGGMGCNDEVGRTIEVYNPKTDNWSFLCKSERRFVNHSVVAV